MRADLTEVVMIIDRSGSMSSCKVESENGVNFFIDEQKKQPGECTFSLVQFDSEYEFLYNGVPISTVGKFEMHPRGMTALLDAVGRAINETGERLSKMNEVDRPGLVVFCIITDGGENSSHAFTKSQVKEMVERQQKDYQWKFVFLGANQDAFGEAASMGIARGGVANYSVTSSGPACSGLAMNVSRMRSATSSGGVVDMSYTAEELGAMMGAVQ